MAAASCATGFRSWLQTHSFTWLTPRRLRGLTVGAMCAAGLVATLGFSGSTPNPNNAPTSSTNAQTTRASAHVAAPAGTAPAAHPAAHAGITAVAR